MTDRNMTPSRKRVLWKTLYRSALILLCVGSLSGLNAASSVIVGHYPIAVPAGNSAWVAGLVTADAFEGAAASVSTDVDGKALVSFTTPGWTGSEFPLHYAEPQSGVAAGLAIDILSATPTTLKLDTTPAQAGLVTGMVFIIRKHATLGGLLPTGGGVAAFSDSISLFSATGVQSTFVFDSSTQRWITGLGADASNTVIRPGQGMVIQLGSPLTLTVGSGEVCCVKATPTRVRVSAGVSNLTGALNPLNSTTTLGALGIRTSLQTFNDSLVILTPGSLTQAGSFLSNGSTLINALGQNADATPLPSGASVVVNVDATKNIVIAPVNVTP